MNTNIRLAGLTLLSAVILNACGGSSGSAPGPGPIDSSGLLKLVASPAELENSIKSSLTVIQTADTQSALASADQRGFSTTYTQEQNVDEFDAVKYDGEFLYIAPTRGFYGCCFLFDTTLVASDIQAPEPPADREIRVMQTDPATGSATQLSAIKLDDQLSVQGMYLDQSRLVTLTTEYYYGPYGDDWLGIASWASQTTGMAIYDTSDAANPSLAFEAKIEGAFIQSRRVGDTVYIVTRHSPTIAGLHYTVTTAQQQAENEALLASASLSNLLPKIRINGVDTDLVRPERCYITNDNTDAGYPVITSITAVPLDDPAAHRTVCYNEDAYGVYVSENALYVSQYKYDPDGHSSSTRVHKFAMAASGTVYRGSAEVDGHLWSGGQADFRMSEHDGYLRLITTEFDRNDADRIDHRLFVLAESSDRLALDVVAQLPNDNQPQEIGKPNEQLFGVRFFEDKAYAVTFLQIDPLYVISLVDPTNPAIEGELEVTGFSDFLHPVTGDLLLGLGQSDNGGVKLELFDVSDISSPLSIGSDTLGGRGSYSEARYDRHAFTYLADIGGVDRFIIPADVYADDGSYQLQESGIFLYEIRDKTMPNLASMARIGSLTPDTSDPDLRWSFGNRNRSIIHDDSVFYIRDDNVWSTFWSSPDLINGPF